MTPARRVEDLWALWGPPENPADVLDPEEILRRYPDLERAIDALASPFSTLDGDGDSAGRGAPPPPPRSGTRAPDGPPRPRHS